MPKAAPSVQFHDVDDAVSSFYDVEMIEHNQDIAEEESDIRMSVKLQDTLIEHDGEFFSGENDQDQLNECNKNSIIDYEKNIRNGIPNEEKLHPL